MTPELQAACDTMPKAHLTYIVTTYGRPRSKYGLGNDFAKWVTEAGLPARCRLHGLKSRGADAGMTTHLADSGIAKLRGQSKNADATNMAAPSHKHAANSLKTKG